MKNISHILRQLQDERNRTQKEIVRLDAAIAAFKKFVGRDGSMGSTPGRPGRKRKLSAAARRRIAQAQKVRWAKYRQQQSSKA